MDEKDSEARHFSPRFGWNFFLSKICRIEMDVCVCDCKVRALEPTEQPYLGKHIYEYDDIRMCNLQTDVNNSKNLLRCFQYARAHFTNCMAELHRFNRIPIDVVISVMNALSVIFPLFSTASLGFFFFFFLFLFTLQVQSCILRRVASHFRFHSSLNSQMKRFSSTHIYSKHKIHFFFFSSLVPIFPRSPFIVNRKTD